MVLLYDPDKTFHPLLTSIPFAAVAALAEIWERIAGLMSADLLCNAPASCCEFNAFRIEVDLTPAKFPLRLKFAASRFRPNAAFRPAFGLSPRPANRLPCAANER